MMLCTAWPDSLYVTYCLLHIKIFSSPGVQVAKPKRLLHYMENTSEHHTATMTSIKCVYANGLGVCLLHGQSVMYA